MRVGFAGTPEFAARILTALVEAPHTIPVCLTQPDRPKGRGLRVLSSPVKTVAERHRVPIVQPPSLKTAEARAPLFSTPIDLLVVAAYGLLLPRSVLEWPRHGCLNVHASLLPRWRGAAPIQRAIEAGDAVTGVTIMQMDAGLDTGPIVGAAAMTIEGAETAGSLARKLADTGATAMVEILERLHREGVLTNTAQPTEGASYARQIEAAEAAVHWAAPAAAIERKLRAFDPEPGAYGWLGGERIKLWRAQVIGDPISRVPGIVLATGSQGID